MSTGQGRRGWTRLGAEFFVIVVGVLVALGVDDFRARRADIAMEHFLLTQLREDLEADRRELDVIIEDTRERQAGSIVLRGGPPGVGVASRFGENSGSGILIEPGRSLGFPVSGSGFLSIGA